jgi:carbamoyltransferase
MSLILGINAWHGDSAAAVVRDGKLVAAVEEERFNRVKHWAGLPVESMRYCLNEAGVRFEELEHIAINLNPRVHNVRRLWHLLKHRPDFGLVLDRLKKRGKTKSVGARIAEAFQGETMRGEVHHVEHHLAHLASSYLCSPFSEAVNLSVDGMGDFASAAWGMGMGQSIGVDGRVYFPHSLGLFYTAMTQWLGFPHYGDEYKVMGLAPYGEPKHMETMQRIVELKGDGAFELNLRYFRHHHEHVPYSWENGAPEVGALYSPALEELLGPPRKADEPLEQRHKDIARSVQVMYEEAFFHLLGALHGKYGSDNLTLSGGCAMNSVANGKVYQRSRFKRCYIQSAAGDAGGAIGAAMIVAQELAGGHEQRHHCTHAYWGPEYREAEYAAVLDSNATPLRQEGCSITRFDDDAALCDTTARAICEGAVVGWFQGRLEWGPRALGNRSILCDPRRADMKDILNAKIKRRESFRPFAPSILRDAVAEWFETDEDVPFMMQVFQIREQQRSRIPAVTHVDGSGRLQTVAQEANPLYYLLISRFLELTGVPMLLNTSFNENEPIVCHPREALDCFLRTKMDLLVLGRTVIRRH